MMVKKWKQWNNFILLVIMEHSNKLTLMDSETLNKPNNTLKITIFEYVVYK